MMLIHRDSIMHLCNERCIIIFDDYLVLQNRKLTKEQQYIEKKLIIYIENKYSVKVHACLFNFEHSNNSVLISVNVFLETELEYQQLINKFRKRETSLFKHPEEGKEIAVLFESFNINVSKNIKQGYNIIYSSFEKCALNNAYSEAFEEIKKFREKHFNPETMTSIGCNELFVTYKSKEIMEKAEKNGEQQYLIDEFYKLIKKYDKHNFITKEKGLVFYFDYPEIKLHPKEYCELFWQRMTRPINECAVIKENNLKINSQIYNQKNN